VTAGHAGVDSSTLRGLLLLCAAATLWGTVGVATRLLPPGVVLSPLDLGFARLAIAAPLLLLFSAGVLGRALWAVTARGWLGIATVGALVAGGQFCLFTSLGQLGIARTSLLTVCLPPMLLAGGSALVFRRPPSARTCGGFLLAFLGLMLVGGGPESDEPSETLLGLATGLLAAVAFASLSCLARIMARVVHPLQIVAFGFVVGAILLAPVAVVSGPAGSTPLSGTVTMVQLVLVLLYLGAGPTALAYICYFYGLRLSRTIVSGIAVTMVEPAVAATLAAGLLSEELSPAAWLGAAFLVLATIALGTEDVPGPDRLQPAPQPSRRLTRSARQRRDGSETMMTAGAT
jgi:drug/metabolite transporter, DME family